MKVYYLKQKNGGKVEGRYRQDAPENVVLYAGEGTSRVCLAIPFVKSTTISERKLRKYEVENLSKMAFSFFSRLDQQKGFLKSHLHSARAGYRSKPPRK